MKASDNRLISDVTPGSAMNRAFKGFWLPVMHSKSLVADGAPIRFTICAENYVAFRATDGRVAVFDELCPHRKCSLSLANNRDNALTCIFHGWKFDVSGKCVETPNEPNPKFPEKVPLKHYPCREAAGVLWVYLGKGAPSRFPDYLFNKLNEDQVLPRRAIVRCNWLTGFEGQIDPSHFAILHQSWIKAAPDNSFNPDIERSAEHESLKIEFEDTGWGFRFAAIRDTPDGRKYVRTTEYVAPASAFIAASESTRKLFMMTVPIDNNTTAQWLFWYNPLGPITPEVRSYAMGNSDPDDTDLFKDAKAKPMWGQDRQGMKEGKTFTGFNDIVIEDLVVQESMGPDLDRTKEFLCSADITVMRARRYVLQRATRLEEGEERAFAHAEDFEYAALQGIALTIEDTSRWREEAQAAMEERRRKFASMTN